MENINETKRIKLDRLCYTKNKAPSLLAYLGIVFDVLYFIAIYKANNVFFYKYIIGGSILVNLGFLLAAFLSSEEIKNYKASFGYVMMIVGVIQLIRLIYPFAAFNADQAIDAGKLARCIIYLVGSAASMIVGGVIGLIRTIKLNNYKASLEANKKEAK